MDSAELAALLVEQAPDGVIFAGTDGVIQVWNTAAERIFGHTAEEAIGQDLNIIIPERFQDAHWRGYDRALGEGATKYAGKALTTRSQRKDGTEIYVELGFAIVKDRAGEVIGASAHARDITERFEQERTNRRRLTALQKVVEEAGLTPPAS
jgi:PAS domain S-box-containing protein